jgi:NDP-sugar pyrophosphorylase family protein
MMEPNQSYDFSFDIFPLIMKQNALLGYFSNGYWRDIGTVPSYLRAIADALAGKISLVPPKSIDRSQAESDSYCLQSKREGQLAMSVLRNERIFPLYWTTLALIGRPDKLEP